jgi:hypothetical protein
LAARTASKAPGAYGEKLVEVVPSRRLGIVVPVGRRLIVVLEQGLVLFVLERALIVGR